MKVGNVFGMSQCLCVSVRPITFEAGDIETSFWCNSTSWQYLGYVWVSKQMDKGQWYRVENANFASKASVQHVATSYANNKVKVINWIKVLPKSNCKCFHFGRLTLQWKTFFRQYMKQSERAFNINQVVLNNAQPIWFQGIRNGMIQRSWRNKMAASLANFTQKCPPKEVNYVAFETSFTHNCHAGNNFSSRIISFRLMKNWDRHTRSDFM